MKFLSKLMKKVTGHDEIVIQLKQIQDDLRLQSLEFKSLHIILASQSRKVKLMSEALEKLSEQVAENTSLEMSAISLIQGLAEQIEELKQEPAALEELAARLKLSAQALSEAIMANTEVDVVV